MKLAVTATLFALFISVHIFSQTSETFYNIEVTNIKGEKEKLKNYQGKVILIVNTASKCGLTPQYEGLELLYRKYQSQGFVVLGFPCNQFLGQEPGTEEEIQNFCTLKYNVTFPLFQKVDVNGEKTHPLYVFLKKEQALEKENNDIRWNFEKFLIDRTGTPVVRYSPKTKPETLESDIEALLK